MDVRKDLSSFLHYEAERRGVPGRSEAPQVMSEDASFQVYPQHGIFAESLPAPADVIVEDRKGCPESFMPLYESVNRSIAEANDITVLEDLMEQAAWITAMGSPETASAYVERLKAEMEESAIAAFTLLEADWSGEQPQGDASAVSLTQWLAAAHVLARAMKDQDGSHIRKTLFTNAKEVYGYLNEHLKKVTKILDPWMGKYMPSVQRIVMSAVVAWAGMKPDPAFEVKDLKNGKLKFIQKVSAGSGEKVEVVVSVTEDALEMFRKYIIGPMMNPKAQDSTKKQILEETDWTQAMAIFLTSGAAKLYTALVQLAQDYVQRIKKSGGEIKGGVAAVGGGEHGTAIFSGTEGNKIELARVQKLFNEMNQRRQALVMHMLPASVQTDLKRNREQANQAFRLIIGEAEEAAPAGFPTQGGPTNAGQAQVTVLNGKDLAVSMVAQMKDKNPKNFMGMLADLIGKPAAFLFIALREASVGTNRSFRGPETLTDVAKDIVTIYTGVYRFGRGSSRVRPGEDAQEKVPIPNELAKDQGFLQKAKDWVLGKQIDAEALNQLAKAIQEHGILGGETGKLYAKYLVAKKGVVSTREQPKKKQPAKKGKAVSRVG